MKLRDLMPWTIAAEIWRHRTLLAQLIYRDVALRYRGAMFGAGWLFLSPLAMLAVFAFVFGQVFQLRWPQQSDALPLWVLMYAGLITFNVFGDTVSRAGTSVRSYPSYVKKMVFPVHILPLVPLGAALVHAGFNYAVLFAALAWMGEWRLAILATPVLLLPVVLLALGASWFVAAWGVFIKDTSQIVPLLVQMLLFLSPVFYPASAIPAALQGMYAGNLLGTAIETLRNAVTGQPVELGGWWTALALSFTLATAGYAFFQRRREEFADAI